MCMYLNLSRGVLRYMLEMSVPINLAFGVESTMLMDFDGLKASGISASHTWVVGDEVSTSCYSILIGIVLFRLVSAHGAGIGDSATVGNLVFVDEEDGVSAFDITGSKSLS